MDKTININLGGSLFQVDEEAFTVLRDYIQAINNRFRNVPGGPETVEDIETRIAEIFRSQKGLAGIITRQNVDSMIAIIGRPEDFETGITSEEPVSGGNMPKRLYRNPDDAVISGVCGGLGAYLNTDPVLFRILFILFALFGGAGLLIYLVFWIAVPPARTDMQKREMYGKSYFVHHASASIPRDNVSSGFNEIIRAVGKVFYIIFRIFLVIFGATLVITGFLFILSFITIFILKIPGAFTHEGIDFSISYLPDMLEYVFSPASAPWIWALSIIVFILPMIALIYWGVRMIFWFRISDGIFNLSMFIVWILSLSALSIMIFNEGVSFAENASSVSRNMLPETPDTLYILSGSKIENIGFDREFTIPDNEYSVFMTDSTRNLYIKPRIRFRVSDGNAEIEIRKMASGRNRREAGSNAESIVYNYDLRKDTLVLDDYFVIPSGKKWSANFVNISIRLPENTIMYFDSGTSGLVGNRIYIESHDHDGWVYNTNDKERLAGRYWTITEKGLRETGRKRPVR